ncbi:MAG: hypothetical protein KDD53_08100 [Bdellovibrionales bacterium]|nr:hypothetical protein [Bdellovibrionales bacterium]
MLSKNSAAGQIGLMAAMFAGGYGVRALEESASLPPRPVTETIEKAPKAEVALEGPSNAVDLIVRQEAIPEIAALDPELEDEFLQGSVPPVPLDPCEDDALAESIRLVREHLMKLGECCPDRVAEFLSDLAALNYDPAFRDDEGKAMMNRLFDSGVAILDEMVGPLIEKYRMRAPDKFKNRDPYQDPPSGSFTHYFCEESADGNLRYCIDLANDDGPVFRYYVNDPADEKTFRIALAIHSMTGGETDPSVLYQFLNFHPDSPSDN